MFFRNKTRTERLEDTIRLREKEASYWTMVWSRFRKNKPAIWSWRILLVMAGIALLADFLANEKPIYCKVAGKSFWPVLHQYAVGMKVAAWPEELAKKDWHDMNYDRAVFPPIPFSPNSIDLDNVNFSGPLSTTAGHNRIFHHYLGTDEFGRDVAAGMVHGVRYALWVGLLAMGIACLIGLPLGALAGYFGDDHLKLSRARLGCNLFALPLAIFYGFLTPHFAPGEGLTEWAAGAGIFLLVMALANLLVFFLKKVPPLKKELILPIDILVMRSIEVFNSIPVLLLILSIVAIIDRPSLIYAILIIGLVRWTSIARFTRAEYLRLRKLEFMQAGKAMGFSDARLLWRHGLPNAVAPVLITIAFGIAGAILLEASLSFLGIGIAEETLTWGSMLRSARNNISAWWVALYPGLALFVTITIFNLMGEGLTDAIDPRKK